jgi:hypothetical protein
LGKLEDRLVRLEQALPASPGRSPYREEFERRVRIGDLYMAWLRGEIEKPELADPRDLEKWEDMEKVRRIAKKIALRRAEAEGMVSEADCRYADEGVE